jgi:hypothetical protein
MKMDGGMIFLSTAIVVSGQFHVLDALSPGERASGTHWLRGLEGLKATLEDEVK